MPETTTSYSNSQGIQLLERAVAAFGPIFTLEQILSLSEHQLLTSQQVRKRISLLARSGWIEILKRGTYAVKSPLYSGDIPPFAIAHALVNPAAISHWSALAYHGFSTQNPLMIQASTPVKVITPEMRQGQAYRPRGRASWRAFDLEFEFIYVKKERFWGFEKQWVNAWTQVNITDRERTVLDLIARPDLFGGIRAASELLEGALSQINLNQLVAYALRYDVGAVIKRLGWLLERMGVDVSLLFPLRAYPVTGIVLLDPNQPRSAQLDPSWQINQNMQRP
ncbi:type IV toxin-antitoxin system AbiEi family antitoxin domain-containing protein [Levilinea saccharolytica]|uniref:type IV toxin-antitoxin system AbiEi family antitoxin domain-containing protein n=1 Tax=Levilinea saccharolytica TaxID=229921 RepID=UPI0009E546B8|nr:type IV toxin-antitoxin system AbiEi family antitoxin [Levilinea saccharolytica]GAP16395.1 predicted transcriptional regulator [Levilinea saccharolytica]